MSGMETSSTHLNTELPSTDWMVPDYCAFDGDFQYANTIHQSVLHTLNLLKSEFSRLPLYRREDRSCSCVRSTRSRSSHMPVGLFLGPWPPLFCVPFFSFSISLSGSLYQTFPEFSISSPIPLRIRVKPFISRQLPYPHVT